MAKIEGIKAVRKKLNALSREAGANKQSVIVGYTANYATHVHESAKMEARRRLRKKSAKNQQWKFLETPARDKKLQARMKMLIDVVMKKRINMKLALYVAGKALQRESQKLVPIDTGNLRASAFTRSEK